MFTMILTWLGQLLGGPFAKAAVDAYRAKLESTTSVDAHTVDLVARELAVEQREAELQTQLLLAEQGNWFTRSVRPLWALPFVIFTWKVVVWDKVLELGSTDELRGWAAATGVTIAGAYFVTRGLEKVAMILKRK